MLRVRITRKVSMLVSVNGTLAAMVSPGGMFRGAGIALEGPDSTEFDRTREPSLYRGSLPVHHEVTLSPRKGIYLVANGQCFAKLEASDDYSKVTVLLELWKHVDVIPAGHAREHDCIVQLNANRSTRRARLNRDIGD